jgi:hypothetical protein
MGNDSDETYATWGDVIRQAAELLLELAGADLLPEEYLEQAESLGKELAGIADDIAD